VMACGESAQPIRTEQERHNGDEWNDEVAC